LRCSSNGLIVKLVLLLVEGVRKGSRGRRSRRGKGKKGGTEREEGKHADYTNRREKTCRHGTCTC